MGTTLAAAVEEVAVFVHGKAAIRVAVKGDAAVQLMLFHIGDKLLHMRRAAVIVDIHAVGRAGQHLAAHAERRKQLFCRYRRRAVGAIDGNMQPVQLHRHGGQQITDIVVCRLFADRHSADRAADRRRQLHSVIEHDRLDLLLQRVGQLIALAVEDLNAVIFTGIM